MYNYVTFVLFDMRAVAIAVSLALLGSSKDCWIIYPGFRHPAIVAEVAIPDTSMEARPLSSSCGLVSLLLFRSVLLAPSNISFRLLLAWKSVIISSRKIWRGTVWMAKSNMEGNLECKIHSKYVRRLHPCYLPLWRLVDWRAGLEGLAGIIRTELEK